VGGFQMAPDRVETAPQVPAVSTEECCGSEPGMKMPPGAAWFERAPETKQRQRESQRGPALQGSGQGRGWHDHPDGTSRLP